MVKFSKFCSQSFHHLTDRQFGVQMLNFSNGKWVKLCVIYLTKNKNFGFLSKRSLLRESRPKCARASPQQCAHSYSCRFHPNRFTFGGVIAERVNTDFAPYSISMICSSRCVPLLQTSHLAWCRPTCLCVGYTELLCKNRLNRSRCRLGS